MNKTVLIKKEELRAKKTKAAISNLMAFQKEEKIPTVGIAINIYNRKLIEYDEKFHPSLKKQRF